MSMNKEIKLVKSLIGRKASHIETAQALGLTKINKEVIKPMNKAIAGMINTIRYMVEVEEV